MKTLQVLCFASVLGYFNQKFHVGATNSLTHAQNRSCWAVPAGEFRRLKPQEKLKTQYYRLYLRLKTKMSSQAALIYSFQCRMRRS